MKPKPGILRAMLGKVVDVPQGQAMAELAVLCAGWRETDRNLKEETQERISLPVYRASLQTKRADFLGSRLVSLLGEGLANVDAKPLEDFAKILRAVERHFRDPQTRFNFDTNAMRLAAELNYTGERVTQKEFLRRLGITKDHDGTKYERTRLKQLGVKFTGKRGRKKGTNPKEK